MCRQVLFPYMMCWYQYVEVLQCVSMSSTLTWSVADAMYIFCNVLFPICDLTLCRRTAVCHHVLIPYLECCWCFAEVPQCVNMFCSPCVMQCRHTAVCHHAFPPYRKCRWCHLEVLQCAIMFSSLFMTLWRFTAVCHHVLPHIDEVSPTSCRCTGLFCYVSFPCITICRSYAMCYHVVPPLCDAM